jgi:anti-sigma B factor antagonist
MMIDAFNLSGVIPMETREINGITVIATDERLDAVSAPTLKEMVAKVAGTGKVRLVIDLAKTQFIDSSGCGSLVASMRAVLKNQGDMRLARPSPQAKTLFELTRLHKVFGVFDDLDAALESFSTDA